MQSQVPGQSVNDSINQAISQIGVISSVTATIVNVPLGWPSAVTPQGNFCGGYDAEGCEAFRARVINRKQFRPNATLERVIEDAKTYPCVTRVLQRTCSDCCNNGVLQLYAFMDKSFANGIAPASALAGLDAFIFGSPQGQGTGTAPIGIFGNFYPVTPATVNINFFNMSCITPSQFKLIQSLIAQLFSTLTPGQTLCSKWIDAIVISVNPNCCNYTINVSIDNPTLGVIDCFNDFAPLCDVLPVLGTVDYSSQLAST
jgi:hypothetical protein